MSRSGRRARSLSVTIYSFLKCDKIMKNDTKYQNICNPPGLVSGSAVAHLLDQFLATFICKVTKGLLGKGHYIFASHLLLCGATFSTQSSFYQHLSVFPLPLLSIEASASLRCEPLHLSHHSLSLAFK